MASGAKGPAFESPRARQILQGVMSFGASPLKFHVAPVSHISDFVPRTNAFPTASHSQKMTWATGREDTV